MSFATNHREDGDSNHFQMCSFIELLRKSFTKHEKCVKFVNQEA